MSCVMGRSCSYGVHLRACLPSASSYTSTHSLASLSRFASCFFLRFSSSSCRTRRLKLCAAPSFSSRSPAFYVRCQAEQLGGSSKGSASRLQQLSTMKRASSLEREVETSEDIHVSSEKDVLAVTVTSKKRATRRKKAVDGSPSPQASENGAVAASDMSATPKKTSARKKMDSPIPDSSGMDTPAAEERPLVKSPRKVKQSTSADGESKVELGSAELEGKVELTASVDHTSSSPSSLPLGILKKSIRKRKASTPISPEKEITITATARTQEKEKSKEKSSSGIDKDEVTADTPVQKSRKKIVSPSLTSEVMSASTEIDTMHEKQAKMDMSASNELDEIAIPAGRRRKQSTKSQTAVNNLVNELPESLSGVPPIGNSIIGSEPTPPPFKEGEEELLTSSFSEHTSTAIIQKRQGGTGEMLPKGTSKVVSTFSQEFKVEPSVSQEVRNVKNSVDKAFLTDEMPVISFAESHTASRRRQSEAWRLQDDSNRKSVANDQPNLAKLSIDTTKVFSEPTSMLEARTNTNRDARTSSQRRQSEASPLHNGFSWKKVTNDQRNLDKSSIDTAEVFPEATLDDYTFDSFKSYSRQYTSKDQSRQREPKSLDKVAFTKGGQHNRAESRTTFCKGEGFSPRTSGMDTLRDASTVQKQMVQGRTPTRAEGINHSKVYPSISEKWESRSQQWVKSNRSSTRVASEAAVQRHETSYRKQFAMTDHKETHSQQGYALANTNRARGLDRKQRKEFSVRNVVANQSSTSSYMQIFGTGFDTGDTVPTVLLFFDRRRFVFNAGEGLHRFSMEHKIKLSKIDHVFLTRVCSETVGGLPGLILTLAEMGETGYTVKTWGPSSLDNLAQAMRMFLPSGWMDHTHSFGPGANDHVLSKSGSSLLVLLLEDELVKISAVLLYPEDTIETSAEKKIGPMLSTVYVCELSTVRGKFDPDKALAKGLRPGFKYGKLQKGESVLSDDGTITVHPEEVLGPSSPGPIVFVVDCPSTAYVSSLTSSSSLQSFFSETGKVVNCMIHIGPTSVTSSEEYQSWMENFTETHHIMAQQEVKVLGMPTLTSSARTLSKLNLVCPWLFPIMEIDRKQEKKHASGRTVAGENLLKYRLRPLSDLGLDDSEVPEVFDSAAAQETWGKLSPEVMKACDMASQVWKRWSETRATKSSGAGSGNKETQCVPACLHQVSREEMELVFLGTGSSQPSRHRNVTGIYIDLFEKGGMLLDCGEGTFAQLKRRYGAKGADDVLLHLKCIWISHMHADHFTGILRVLSARRELLQAQSICEPILVIGPKALGIFLQSYGGLEDLLMEFLDCSQTTLEVGRWADNENAENRVGQKKEGLINGSTRSGLARNGMQHLWKQPGYHIQQGIDVEGRKKLKRVLGLLGLKDLYSVPVIHCPNAFAVVLEAQEKKASSSATKPGWKLVYSGDTRPCPALVEAAHKATILIHEATFEDELIAEAVKKNHSITNEAIKVGVDAGVYRMILTHFSQRYPTIPSFDTCFGDRACMAFDMMSVNLADLPVVPEFLPALQMLFKDQSDGEEEAEGALALNV